MRWIRYLLLVLLLGGLLAGFVQQRFRLRELEARLEAQKHSEEALRGQDERRRALLAVQASTEELERLRAELAEVESLRKNNAAAKAELEKKAAAKIAPLAVGFVPLSDFAAAGTGTPMAAGQSFFYHLARSDINELQKLIMLDPKAKAVAAQLFASLDPDMREALGSPERFCALGYQALFRRVQGVQGLAQNFTDAEHATWNLRVQTQSGKQTNLSLRTQLQDGAWKLVSSESFVRMASAYLIDADGLNSQKK